MTTRFTTTARRHDAGEWPVRFFRTFRRRVGVFLIVLSCLASFLFSSGTAGVQAASPEGENVLAHGRFTVDMATYLTQHDIVYLAPASPGDILELDLEAGRTLMVQSSCYLASTPEVTLDTKWGGAKGFFSGTGLFLLKLTGPGRVWITSFGAMAKQDVELQYVVDTGHIVAFEETLEYRISKVGGLKSLFFSGEGLVARFSGTGALYVQTRDPGKLASLLHPFRPVEKSD